MSTPESPSSDDFEQAKARFLDGLACHSGGDFVQAEQHYLASLRLMPGRASTLINLAATQLRLARPAEALVNADAALAVLPDDTDALLHRATALAELGRPQEALAAFDRLLARVPGHAIAWASRGSLLREMHRPAEAAQAFREALRHGADAELTGYYLAAVDGSASPRSAPRAYVKALFDRYAGEFDQHLVGQLRYQAHRRLVEGMTAIADARYESALDLGCGTGLSGPLVRPFVDRLTGLDLSARMLDKARALGAYDRLELADAAEYLAATGERFDLILATDVFIYIGALEPVFAGVRRVMERGVFCFSAEALPDTEGDVRLLPSLRYAHSKAYLLRLAAAHDLDVLAMQEGPVREDQGLAIDGLYVYLGRRAGT